MRKLLICVIVTVVEWGGMGLFAQQLAFPGAEGFGRYASGGRNGSVYHVTNLHDSGTGSLRDAISAPNRIVVFDVGGVIKINSVLVFSSNLYIAGQTAPGEGITVYGNRVSFSGANNTICRYMKFRMGSVYGDSGKDACGIANGNNMIFDHCSISWGRDETFSISGDDPSNITIQNCIISQGLLSHSAGGLIQTNGGVTLYRNLYIDNDTRNNKIKGINQYVNNMVYNWSSAAYIMGGESEGDSYANCVSNYFIKGPNGGNSPLSGANENFHIYADDNWFDNNQNGVLDGYEVPYNEYSGDPDFQNFPYNYPELPTISATELFDQNLPIVGASLPCRDLVDFYLINEVRSLGSAGDIITSEDELPFGRPDTWMVWGGTKKVDTDNDGMPDDWEIANGLNVNLASDAMVISNGYTNLEKYINSIDASQTQMYLRAPLNLRLKSSAQNSVTLTWFDYTDREEGFVVERQVDGVFVEVGRTSAEIDSFEVTGLEPEEVGLYRVKAYNSSMESSYSNQFSCKTKPIPAEVIDLNSYAPNLIWNGNTSTVWDHLDANWSDGTSTVVFADSSQVLFNDTPASNQVVSLAGELPIKAIVVHSALDYSFSGSGYLSGPGSVNKAGVGNLSLLTNHTYTGATVLHNGTLTINSLANGGVPSSIGASKSYDFNWVWKGGTIQYSGGSVSTDRNVALEENTLFSVSNSGSVVTMTGSIGGSGSLMKGGPGRLKLQNVNPYEGPTIISGGILEINGLVALEGAGMGNSGQVILKGGGLVLSGGNSSVEETFLFNMLVQEGTTNSLQVDTRCRLPGKVSGGGTLNFNIYYVREYLKGDWSQFSGTLYANGLGTTSDGNQLMLDNKQGIPNGRVVATGTTKIVCWTNESTMYFGGLSGTSTTFLSGADKANNSAKMTWVIGGAGTDETFSGIINNECSNKNYKGVTSIVKEGNGIWRLTGANVYSGTTTVKGGTLIVNGTHSGTAKVFVQADGTLAGKGKMPGAVEIQSGGCLEPGDNSISSFTVSSLSMQVGSQINMEINKTNSSMDKVVATGAITYAGTLTLSITGTLSAGDQFTLFSGSSHFGSFNRIVPEIPGEGLVWSFSGGILKVIAATPVSDLLTKGYIVAPNPSQGNVHIDLGRTFNQIHLLVESLGGELLLIRDYMNQNQLDLDLHHLTPGYYLLRITADEMKLDSHKLLIY